MIRTTLAAVALTVAAATPTATPPPANLPPSLPLTTSGIHLGMEFNYQETTVNGRKPLEGLQSAGAPVDYVFGADCLGRGSQANIPDASGHVFHDYYLSWPRDAACGVQQPLAWYQAHHPDWLLYTADHQTVPFVWGDNTAIPLDFTNPAVQAYVISTWIKPALAAGFQGVVFDNGPGANYLAAAGHFDQSGAWVQLYSGQWSDPVYASAQALAFAQIVAQVHAFNPFATVGINQGNDCNDMQYTLTAGDDAADLIMDQQGFTTIANYANAFCPGGKWLTAVQWAVHLQRDQGKAMFYVNPEPYVVAPYQTDTDPAARADLQWNLANYLLVKYSHTYFWWGGTTQQAGTLPIPQHEYSLAQAIGSPRGDYYQLQTGVWARNYTGGITVVNPSKTAAATVSFPPGQLEDLYGNPVTTLAMPAHTGDVLLVAPPATPTREAATATPSPTATPAATATATPAPTPTDTPLPTPTPLTCSTVTLSGQDYSLCLAP